MEMLADEPAIDVSDKDWPIWTQATQLPPARVIHNSRYRSFVANSILSGGTVVRGAAIDNSVLAPNVEVGNDTILEDSVVLHGARIGAHCTLKRVIIDSGTVVPNGTTVVAPQSLHAAAGDVMLLTNDSIAEAIRDQTLRSHFGNHSESGLCTPVGRVESSRARSASIRATG
jgi:glucose-1-phosphate adenylyltransferase